MASDAHDELCDGDCIKDCSCGRGFFPACKYKSCYDCFLDRRADYIACIFCGRWHNPEFDTCFTCRPLTHGRDDAARALRQLILWRDQYACRYCGAVEGELQMDPRKIRPACQPNCRWEHSHLIKDDDGLRATTLHVDHIVPCKHGGRAVEWNLQVLCNVCNISKGATWYPGCRHDHTKTRLCKAYRLIANGYFSAPTLEDFMSEWGAFRATGTWDPARHSTWRQMQHEEKAVA
jgi:5-methylcytosine-specific restriction endonuclease McrA